MRKSIISGKLCSLLMMIFVFVPVSAWGGVSLSAFPDASLRDYISRFYDTGWTEYDSDGNPIYAVGAKDGILADIEIANATSLWLGGRPVTSLKGIEYLTA